MGEGRKAGWARHAVIYESTALPPRPLPRRPRFSPSNAGRCDPCQDATSPRTRRARRPDFDTTARGPRPLEVFATTPTPTARRSGTALGPGRSDSGARPCPCLAGKSPGPGPSRGRGRGRGRLDFASNRPHNPAAYGRGPDPLGPSHDGSATRVAKRASKRSTSMEEEARRTAGGRTRSNRGSVSVARQITSSQQGCLCSTTSNATRTDGSDDPPRDPPSSVRSRFISGMNRMSSRFVFRRGGIPPPALPPFASVPVSSCSAIGFAPMPSKDGRDEGTCASIAPRPDRDAA